MSITAGEAIEANERLISELRKRIPFSSRDQRQVNQPLEKWTADWIRSHLDDGVILAPLMRLEPGYWARFAQILQGEAPYTGISLYVTLRNVSSRPVRIVKFLKQHVTYKRTYQGAFVDGDTSRGEEIIEMLAPQQEITLEARYAILAIQHNCQTAYPPTLWEASGSIPQTNPLEEVGFQCTLGGEPLQSKKKRKKAA